MKAVYQQNTTLAHTKSAKRALTPVLTPRFLALHSSDSIQMIRVSEVLRVEADSNYSVIHTSDGRSLTVSKTLKAVAAAINSNFFVRVHASHLVLLTSIRELTRDHLVMQDGVRLPVSRRRRAHIIEGLASIATSI